VRSKPPGKPKLGPLIPVIDAILAVDAPVASGWSDLAGWGLHPLESAALPRRTV
jgi:hypothetical protein